LEREAELAQLQELAEAARAGEGRVVLVEGPAGIGKTRLLDAVRGMGEPVCVLTARPSELDRAFPFGVVRQLFEPLLSGDDPAAAARLLGGAASQARRVLGPDAAPAAPASDADAALGHFHALYWLVANLAEERPAMLVIDDVHWCDPQSLRFVQFLLPRVAELPVLVVLAARSSEPASDPAALAAIATDPATTVLRPAALSEEGVGVLVETTLGDEPDPGFCRACRDATGGNPFLLGELLRELAAEGVAAKASARAHVRQLAPPTVARAVLLRLARLGEGAVALARAVAVLGDSVPLHRAAGVAGMSIEEAGAVAALLARSEILAATRPLAFTHPILRAAVYGDLDVATRARLHARAAEVLADEVGDPEILAVHLLMTEPAGSPDVVATLRAAAGMSIARGASDNAVACLRRAIEEPPTRAERPTLLLELASAELRAGDAAASSRHFAEGLPLSDPRARLSYVHEHAGALFAQGRGEEAFAVLEHEIDAEGSDRELALLADAHLIALANFDLTRVGWARARLERYAGQLTGANLGERMLLATGAHIGTFFGEAGADDLADAAERAIGAGELLTGTEGTSPTYYQAIDILILADRVDAARRAIDRALDYARRRGSAPVFAFASGWRCWLMHRLGELREAEADGHSCVELAMPQGWFLVVPLLLGNVVEVLVDQGEPAEAERLLRSAGMMDRPADDFRAFWRVVYARIRLAVAQGRLADAQADAAALAACVGPTRFTTYPVDVPATLAATSVALADPDPETARADAERRIADARRWGTARAIGTALHSAALLQTGDERSERLAQAVAILSDSPARLEHARALVDLGATLRRGNRRASARAPLREALDIADACAAHPLATRAGQELSAAGGRPRRPRISGVDSLTASERRIAGMAAGGMSNPEIAQALFVTKKTVESHLSNAYRKLDITSRSQLPADLAD
jgi:DNA-binding CsgD family transcriptional regulator